MKAKKIVAIVLALVMVLALGTSALAATGDMSNPVTAAGLTLHFGDPEYPATDPECNMYFKETADNTYDAIYSTDGTTASTSFYPSILAFYVEGTVTSITGTDIDFVTYDQETGAETISSAVEVNDEGFYTIKPKSSSSQLVLNGSVTVNFSAPISATAAAGSIAKAVCGYLPVGQFARYNSFGWGTIFTDNTNVYDSSKQAKFVSSTGEGTSYVATGVSLGMAGGYVQFDMGTDANGADRLITNDPTNPYGIDFIVYGNAFKGNPEAGIVKVSQDGTKWYTLAGSRHYMSDTQWNQTISYARIEGTDQQALNDAFTADGVYYSTDYVSPNAQTQDAIDTAIAAATWQGIPSASTPAAVNLSYWPEWANRTSTQAENYGNVWTIGTDSHIAAVSSASNTLGVNWDKADKVTTTPNGAEVITYSGLTVVPDDTVVLKNQGISSPSQAQMTDVYQWGYSDVRPNGADYGTAINPYAAAPSTQTGGDGFDLSWAVDDNGVPVKLEGVRYIRVYSGVLFNAGVFGETSTEVCGLYVTSNTISAGAGTTARPTVKLNGTTLDLTRRPAKQIDENVVYVDNGLVAVGKTITVEASSDALVFINGEACTSYTITNAAKPVQIVVQNGDAEPYIVVLK